MQYKPFPALSSGRAPEPFTSYPPQMEKSHALAHQDYSGVQPCSAADGLTGVSAMYLTSVMSAASSMAGDIDNSRSLMQAGLVSTVRYTAFNDEADAELAKRLLTESRSLAQRSFPSSNTDPALAATFAETLP